MPSFVITQPGYCSATIHDQNGKLVRQLFCRRFYRAGEHRVAWDGFDQHGTQLADGTYELRIVNTTGFICSFVAMLGTSLGVEQWPGNHGPIQSIAAGDSGYLVAISRGDNTSPFELTLSHDGLTSIAEGQQSDGGRIAATAGATTQTTETTVWYQVRTGVYSESRGVLRKQHVVSANQQGVFRGEWDIKLDGQSDADWTDRPYGIAALGDIAVVAYPQDGLVRFFDCAIVQSGSGVKPPVILASHTGVATPRDVALVSQVAALILDATSVTSYNRQTDQAATLISGLVDATAIDRDGATGDIYVVTDEGSRVRRYNAAGVAQATYGSDRTDGAYSPTAFAGIRDIAAVSGGFWVAEAWPRRLALFNTAGQHVRDRFGPQFFYNAACPDAADSSRIWLESGTADDAEIGQQVAMAMLDLSLNWTTGGWSVSALRTFPRAVADDYRDRWAMKVANDTRFFVLGTGRSGGLVVRERPDGSFALANVFYPTATDWNSSGMNAGEAARTGEGQNFIYTNSTDDNAYDQDDYVWSNVATDGHWGFFDDDLNYYHWSHFGDGKLWKIARTGFNGVGNPTYAGFAAATLIADPALVVAGDRQVSRWTRLSDGRFVALIHDDSQPPIGSAWSDSLYGRWWLACFDNGALAWQTGWKNLHNIEGEDRARPGHFCEPCHFAGEINGCLIVSDRVGTPGHVFTLDGICVGTLLDSAVHDSLEAHHYDWWDTADFGNTRHHANARKVAGQGLFQYDMLKGGAVFAGADADEVRWLPHGRNNVPAMRVTGWDGWERVEAEFAHARRTIDFSGTGLTGEYYDSADWTGTPQTRDDADLRMWFGNYRGAYNADTEYAVGDIVANGSTDYRYCLMAGTGHPLASAGHWYPIRTPFLKPNGGHYRLVSAPGVTDYALWSARWSGRIIPLHSGPTTFVWEGDAAELWIAGRKVIDLSDRYGQAMEAPRRNSRNKFFHAVSRPLTLTSGVPTAFELKLRVSSPVTNWRRGHGLYQEEFSPRACLWWATDGLPLRLIEPRNFLPS